MKQDIKARTDAIALWLTSTRRGKVVLWLMETASFALGALVTGFILYNIETKTLPVIAHWKMDPVEREGDTYILSGTLLKKRPCTLLATSIMAVPKVPLAPRVTLYQIKPGEIDGGQLPTGLSTWGPWRMAIPKALLDRRSEIAWIDVIGHHRCHGFWDQETYYGKVEMTQLP